MLKILLLQESNWIDRGPHQQHHLMEKLQERGHTIRVIDFDIDWRVRRHKALYVKRTVILAKGKTSSETITVIRPTTVRIPILVYLFVAIFHLIEIIRQFIFFKPDIVIGFGLLNSFIGSKIKRIFGVPFIYYLIDSLHTLIPERVLKPLGKTLERNVVRTAEKVIVINKKLADYTYRFGPKNKLEIVSAGIDISRFNPMVDGSGIRKKFGYSQTDFVLFFMGWIYEFSGVVEVAEVINRSRQNLQLLILGKGDMFPKLAEISQLNRRVRIVKWVSYDDVPQYIAASDVCILPSFRNDIMNNVVPIKMYEYLGCGKPVISTKLRGIMKEFGTDSGVVYVSTPSDTFKMAEQLSRNSERYNKLCLDSIHRTSGLSWNLITDLFENILNNCLIKNYEF